MFRLGLFDVSRYVPLDHGVGFFETYFVGLYDEGFGYFAFAVRRDGDYDAVCHGRVGEEVCF